MAFSAWSLEGIDCIVRTPSPHDINDCNLVDTSNVALV